MAESTTVWIPGTTANVGPGFDCLGIALAIYNVVEVARGAALSSHSMAQAAAARFFADASMPCFDFAWKIHGSVPRSRGMGSSVTVRLGVLHGLNELAGRPLDAHRLFELCAELEGHPDNAAPAAYGGFTVARADGTFQRFEVDSAVAFALLIPDFEVRTADARQVLPASVPLSDAVKSLANAASIAAAFACRNYAALRGSFEDFLHQPYRTPLVPMLPAVLAAGIEAGAIGGWLSGSGSTIACITLEKAEAVAAAMLAASGLAGARTIVTKADNTGVRVR